MSGSFNASPLGGTRVVNPTIPELQNNRQCVLCNRRGVQPKPCPVSPNAQKPRTPPVRVTDASFKRLMDDVEMACRTSYGETLPNTFEFRRFFSPGVIKALREAVYTESGGYYPSDEELIEKMLVVFSDDPGVASDPMEPMREHVTQKMADQHVRMKLMPRVVEELGYEVKQANAQWDYYAKNMNGPTDLPDDPICTKPLGKAEASAHGDWLMEDENGDCCMPRPPKHKYAHHHRKMKRESCESKKSRSENLSGCKGACCSKRYIGPRNGLKSMHL